MRTLLILFGGLALAGAIADGALAALLGMIIVTSGGDQSVSLESLVRDFAPALPFLDDADGGRGPRPSQWFALSALGLFPVRIILGVTIAAAALLAAAKARRS